MDLTDYNKDHFYELSANQKQHRLVVVLDGGTTLTSEQVRVKQATKVSMCLARRTDEPRVGYKRLTMSFTEAT